MGRTIIHSALLFDGQSSYPNSTVIFDTDTGKISSVLKSTDHSEKNSSDAVVIDGTGHTLLPGLIEAHMHCHPLHLPPGADPGSIARSSLKSGITTLCDMFSAPRYPHAIQKESKEELEKARKEGNQGRITMSDLKSSLYAAMIEGGWPKPIVLGREPSDELKAEVATWPNVTVDTAGDFVKANKKNGADYIKLMQEDCCALAMPTGSVPSATLELQTAIVKAGHAEGMVVAGHALSLENTEIVLKSGADGLTHTFIDQAPTEEIIQLYKKTGAFVIPTFCVLTSSTNDEEARRVKFADIASKKAILDDVLKPSMIEALGIRSPEAKIEFAYETIRRLKEEGVDILAGTDAAAGLKGTSIGPSLWMELELYVEKCGFSVLEALRAATSITARRLHFNDRGSIEEGKRADLVLVKGDVTKDLAALWEGEGIVGVWKEGIKAS